MPIQYLKEIDALGLTKDEYVILGSAAAMAIGYPKDANEDIDIYVVRPAFSRIVNKLTPVEKAGRTMYTNSSGHLDINFSIDVFDSGFNDVFRFSHMIDGYRYLNEAGLEKFYQDLCARFQMQKHVDILCWLYAKSVRTGSWQRKERMKIYTHETTDLRRLAILVALIGLSRGEPYSQMHNDLVLIPKKEFLGKIVELQHFEAMEYNRQYEYANSVHAPMSHDEYMGYMKRCDDRKPIVIVAAHRLGEVTDVLTKEYWHTLGCKAYPSYLQLNETFQQVDDVDSIINEPEILLLRKIVTGADSGEITDKRKWSAIANTYDDIVDACTSDDLIPHSELILLTEFPINGYPGKSGWPKQQTDRRAFDGLETWIMERIGFHMQEF